ncbi:hypothetical protein SAMCFNEI73_Ch2315 [Sinorhizobium americanum]|uniref:Uncharacterized protein n=1 Tax=Sinorhizobium americanum TaxID=194963 RepID=A0A1L3LNH6_9HYPH|nr:hypothetical protein SAMCFNEI73_Ch2315 [Sinorhizobium americanum]
MRKNFHQRFGGNCQVVIGRVREETGDDNSPASFFRHEQNENFAILTEAAAQGG